MILYLLICDYPFFHIRASAHRSQSLLIVMQNLLMIDANHFDPVYGDLDDRFEFDPKRSDWAKK